MEQNSPSTYDTAVAEARRQRAGLGPSHDSANGPLLMTHGRKTDVAVAWLHGLTNCPRQFELLGRRCHERGWNVWIPLAPHHGLSDRMSDATRLLTVEDLAQWAESAADVARGLGDRVVVGGLSMGGAAAAWLGQRRPDVDVALSMAPVITPLAGPPALSRLATVAMRALPNVMVWWDPKAKESISGPTHAYYRYSMRGMASILRMGFSFADAARREAPNAKAFRLVLNDNDEALKNTLALRVAETWERRGASNTAVIRLGRELGLIHDFIDPDQVRQRVDVAYPLIVSAITEALGTLGRGPVVPG